MANSISITSQQTSARGSFFDSLGVQLTFLAWRNLWRSRRRTWFTIGGIAFAVWMLIFGRSMQEGTFDVMIDNGARLMTGHIQVQHPDYQDDPRIEHSFQVDEALPLLRAQSAIEFASARAQGFALVSAGERSFGAQIIGIDAEVESQWSEMADVMSQGHFADGPGQIVIGATLARNLGLSLGDEMVILGTARQGGVAAFAADVTGIFDAAQPEFNRSIVYIHIDDFRDAWAMASNEAHAIIAIADGVAASERVAERLQSQITGQALLGWRDLMPEAEQMRDMKAVSMEVMFIVITIIITFSVINTFMMVMYERTPEFGVQLAIGMRPGLLQWQVQIEAFYLSSLGLLIGLLLSWLIILIVGQQGIPIPVPEDAQEYYERFNMGNRIYPEFDWAAFRTAAIVLFVAVQAAAFFPALRLRRLRPVEAIRQES